MSLYVNETDFKRDEEVKLNQMQQQNLKKQMTNRGRALMTVVFAFPFISNPETGGKKRSLTVEEVIRVEAMK